MNWFANVTKIEPPRWVTILLALIAGFIDACTFLGLYRLFVAQLTGSYVVAGTALFAPSWPEATVLLAGPVFFVASMAATFISITAGANGLPSRAFALGLETALLAAFTGVMIFGAPFPESPPFSAFIAALLGLSAMGVQSALVRLLLRGVGSTNVMTTNTTQIAIEATRAALTWALRHSGDPNIAREHEAARRGLSKSVPLPLGFFVGIMTGALAYGFLGSWVLVLPTGIAGALTVWAFRVDIESQAFGAAHRAAHATQPDTPALKEEIS